MSMMREGVEKAIEALKPLGGGAELARRVNLTRQAIYQWDRIPAELVLTVEKISGVPRHELRPDLYPPEPEPQRAVS